MRRREEGKIVASSDVAMLLSFLGERPCARETLAYLMNTSDRKARKTIEDARQAGHLVIWSDGLYRIATTREEFDAWIDHEVNSRLGSFFAQKKAMTETATRRWPDQLRLIA